MIGEVIDGVRRPLGGLHGRAARGGIGCPASPVLEDDALEYSREVRDEGFDCYVRAVKMTDEEIAELPEID
jgi:hypothetical protein